MGINAFTLAHAQGQPEAQVKVVWVNSWYDPGKEGDAAKTLIDQGADIICQHTDSPAPLQAAEERGVHGFGQASDMTGLRAQGAAHRDPRQLVGLLHRARPGGARRHLEDPQHLVRA